MRRNIRIKDLLTVLLPAVILLVLTFWLLLSGDKTVSAAERRQLAAEPQLTWDSFTSGSYTDDFETYLLDQFPMRDTFRGVKSWLNSYLFAKTDLNGVYLSHDHLSKIVYPLNDRSLTNAAGHMRNIYEEYLAGKDVRVFLSVIPDKNAFLAPVSGRPSMDYSALRDRLVKELPQFTYIDIFDKLALDRYYRTDTHWQAQMLLPVAQTLAQGMNVVIDGEDVYTLKSTGIPFYGVYSGQYAQPVLPDDLTYMTSPAIEGASVFNRETEMTGPVFDLDRANGLDPYEMFLSGPCACLTITNPSAAADRKLVVFRDSFGSSLIPYLISGYSEIVVLDTRYIHTYEIGDFLTFDNQDVLFIYNTALLNDSFSLK